MVAVDVGQHVVGVVVQAFLQALGAELGDGMRRYLDFQVGADVLDFGVEILHQQDDPQVSVLQLVLVPGILADATGVPALASEVNDGAGFVEEAHDFRADQPAIELADGIDAAGEDPDAGQINNLSVIRMNKDTTRREGESIQTNTDKILDFHSFNFLKLTTIDRFEIGLSDVLQGRQRA